MPSHCFFEVYHETTHVLSVVREHVVGSVNGRLWQAYPEYNQENWGTSTKPEQWLPTT
jgi:hypothetical protein